jgi:hypothetical protein
VTGPVPPRVPRQQAGSCGGCLAFAAVTLGDLAVLFWAAVQGQLVIVAFSAVLLFVIVALARQSRGIG